MQDPHVVSLTYAIGSAPNIVYNNPPPLEFENVLGNFELRNGVLKFLPAEHFDSERDAKAAVEPFLRAWVVVTDLLRNFGTLRFSFEGSEIVDRIPRKPGERVIIAAEGRAIGMSFTNATLTLGMSQYPIPPTAFQATLEAETGYRRWEGFIAGREPLQSMAYYVLTLVEATGGGGRAGAAKYFCIDEQVLSTIGRLSSTKGHGTSARKVARGAPPLELTSKESHWLDQATRRLIHRLGEHTAVAALPMLSMSDLPEL